ncbi:MAG: GGDEF-domain containing protein [Alphaproteobacteria bacterium]|nr:MAG: GGDEF-domain containing protein [Alphaproteobacteria bacterium]
MVQNRSSFENMWNSRLVWRVAIALFVVILGVNAVFSAMSLSQFEKDRLYDLRELGLYSVIPALSDKIQSQKASPIDQRKGLRLVLTTPISGLKYYNLNKQDVGSNGQPLTLELSLSDALDSPAYYNREKNVYEVTYTPTDLGVSFYIVTQIDASRIHAELMNAIKIEIIIVLLLSTFVTLVLMIALSRWFLDPILALYYRLLRAAKNPENPPIPDKSLHTKTEIGRAIQAADILMSNNAESIKRIKAMAESEVNRLAFYDTLTGLPNRTFFIKTLKETLAAADENFLDRYAVFTMDIDHFKDINDTMGHSVGDEVLKAFADRLAETLPNQALLARSGEDEFAVMLPLNQGLDEGEERAEEIINAFRSEAINVMDEAFQVRCSIGVAISPDDADLPEEVLRCADIALNKAKSDGRDRVKRYDGTYVEDIQKRFQILRDLRVAMDLEELELYYQPQLDLKTGTLKGAEALIRWWRTGENGTGGHFVSPVDFIPVAEQSGLILPLGDWIMRESCKAAKSWSDAGLGDLTVAVNVSGHQFLQKDIVEKIERTIIETGIKPHQLEVEVTESVFMEDTDHSIKMLKGIQALGVAIAIDDFGTGYSSLSYLQRFPMDKLKIDRSFVRHLDEQHDNLVLTRTIIALCKTMNLKVVAEGVESKAEEQILIDEGCDYVQGFRYSAPIPNIKFQRLAKEYNGQLDYFD